MKKLQEEQDQKLKEQFGDNNSHFFDEIDDKPARFPKPAVVP